MGQGNVADNAEQLHVFDLPQLYTKPSADILLQTLGLLTSAPPSWECSDSEDYSDDYVISTRRRRSIVSGQPVPSMSVSNDGVPRYLTGIISSNLDWILDEKAKELIWEQASLRLSERSGRSAMPAMTRKFRIPSVEHSTEIAIHEPALTADNLGLKTWASSYQLARRLRRIAIPSELHGSWALELGAGTGLVGISASATLGWRVCLTDLPDIVSNLQRNVDANVNAIDGCRGQACVGVLDWTKPETLTLQCVHDVNTKDAAELPTMRFGVVLVADALYSSDHPRLLVNAIIARLLPDKNARVIVELPLREAFCAERDEFKERMADIELVIIDQGQETGYDDWGWTGDAKSRDEVRCWWSIWGRS
ncbi:hypothetical protein EJ05DRAFT_505364 [Pseudovirgaria hyperparasitica]|uniref:Glucose-inducible SAM-dependent methyltransferase Rrg1 n=1 Tax=Pseudovirgaria hyperparasitica TaxID=470096 RepID=A0A6A6VSP3_9PEZI|nr:uncharacterized protein EJ05DRAFT_505364 [Pseudovirgaria hyperparasitica]KAF2753175.1 hypothetical protein EJ05DRAFT_505364 [Pseudovirgaria hyperparasitica]